MSILLGIDVGTSAVKASLLDSRTGVCLASSPIPDTEIARTAPNAGWCEQEPESWWKAVREAVLALPEAHRQKVSAVGVAYQMHGLVLIDRKGAPVRPAIIWSDARATQSGVTLAKALGKERCDALLNLPGNFTMSKLRWIRDNEPQSLKRTWKAMLPGDYIAYRMTGVASTTSTGLSEMIAWDYDKQAPSTEIWDAAGGRQDLMPDLTPIFGEQGRLTDVAAWETGLPSGIPVSYRAGDQPNNALSLNVLLPGEVAATVGTSGVLYRVCSVATRDPQERLNMFLHVNSSADRPLLGALLCVNGAGGFYSWVRRTLSVESFEHLNVLAERADEGAAGLLAYPYGNGAERSLGNRAPGGVFCNLDVNRHTASHIARAAQEAVLFAIKLGSDVMSDSSPLVVVRAGATNMFKSALFSQMFADLLGAKLELFDTEGSLGAARGAGIGSGAFIDFERAYRGLKLVQSYMPDETRGAKLRQVYETWRDSLDRMLG